MVEPPRPGGRPMSAPTGCRACERRTPKRGRARCPECDRTFRGPGWEGIDAHWKAHHLDVMSYEAFWSSLCAAHRAAEPLDCPACRKRIPTAGPRQCPECALVLRGKGWAGIEAHWQANHSQALGYEEFWLSLCPAHRGGDEEMPYLPFDAPAPRAPRRTRR